MKLMNQGNEWFMDNFPFLFSTFVAIMGGVYWLSSIINGNNKAWREQKSFNREMREKNDLSLQLSRSNELELIRVHGLLEKNNVINENINNKINETLIEVREMRHKAEEDRALLMTILANQEKNSGTKKRGT